MTLLEILVVVGIIAILAAIAIPAYSNYVEKARVSTAIADIRVLEVKINAFYADNGRYPQDLGELNMPVLRDPWQTPYQYINIADEDPKKLKCRKDGKEHPINSDFDLYSMGRDQMSVLPLTAKPSQDDIIRSKDGRYVGLAEYN